MGALGLDVCSLVDTSEEKHHRCASSVSLIFTHSKASLNVHINLLRQRRQDKAFTHIRRQMTPITRYLHFTPTLSLSHFACRLPLLISSLLPHAHQQATAAAVAPFHYDIHLLHKRHCSLHVPPINHTGTSHWNYPGITTARIELHTPINHRDTKPFTIFVHHSSQERLPRRRPFTHDIRTKHNLGYISVHVTYIKPPLAREASTNERHDHQYTKMLMPPTPIQSSPYLASHLLLYF